MMLKRSTVCFAIWMAGLGICQAVEVAPKGWRVAPLNGAPGLYKDGKPVAPMFFWQWEIEEQDAKAMTSVGIDQFGVFGSFPHYANPYWKPEGFAGMAYQDRNLDKVLAWSPNAAFLPRLFYSAPDWWIAAHPEEQIRYSNPSVLPPPQNLQYGSIPRESFTDRTYKLRFPAGAGYGGVG